MPPRRGAESASLEPRLQLIGLCPNPIRRVIEAHRPSLSDAVARYLAASFLLGLSVGLGRALWRFVSGTLPNQYLSQALVVNALLVMGCALLALPLCLIARRWLPRLAGIAGIVFAYLLFWGLNTSVPYRSPFSAAPGVLQGELSSYGPGLIAVALMAIWSLTPASLGAALKRAALGSAALLLATAVLATYSAATNPSNVDPIGLRPSAKAHPNVFVVLVDTLRADQLSAYGLAHPTSPNVDRLARDGVLYSLAFAHAPWTRPSCGALLTGRYPPEIGLRGLWTPLSADVPILPQLMEVEGYATAGIVSSVHVSAQFGFDKGFDLLDIGKSYLGWTGVKSALTRLRLIRPREIFPQYNAAELTDRVITWVDGKRGADEPLFMYLHYLDPHGPYRPPEDQDRWREFAGEEGKGMGEPPDRYPEPTRELPSEEYQALMGRYRAEIAYFDEHFGRFLDYLDQEGLYDESLIIITSDHGEEFYDHGEWGHGHSLYNELLRVPLIVKYPAELQRAGQVVDRAVALVDVVPTVQDVLGGDWSGLELRGESLLTEAPDRVIYADNWSPETRKRTLVSGNDKLIQKVDARGNVLEEQYFSLADVAEAGDGQVPSDMPAERMEFMREKLRELDKASIPLREITVDAETRAEMRDLGYAED